MPFTSFNAKLMYNTGTEDSPQWKQLVPIKNIPQIGGEPEQLETTTLDDKHQTFIDGIESQEPMRFTVNADKAQRATLKTLKGVEKQYSIWLGAQGLGEEGKFTGKGKLTYYMNEAGVNEVVQTTIVITPTTPFEEEDD